ncbi:unnamed protein product, partial [Durusdinium trenchii]
AQVAQEVYEPLIGTHADALVQLQLYIQIELMQLAAKMEKDWRNLITILVKNSESSRKSASSLSESKDDLSFYTIPEDFQMVLFGSVGEMLGEIGRSTAAALSGRAPTPPGPSKPIAYAPVKVTHKDQPYGGMDLAVFAHGFNTMDVPSPCAAWMTPIGSERGDPISFNVQYDEHEHTFSFGGKELAITYGVLRAASIEPEAVVRRAW